ncbi:recombinase family protein [Klenkia sp. PcliD-1-E]|uniref:recombinase family protein n=1 Tax=Klenkia sp. PcliD-1-E TaxID=2954492 RepID=UPI002098411B|nr:recombinase family protein [Klenkia sp. PcliD-1-E]MCO7218539.1 recombinase family protein [Klenkia sp. PcliD-1-E]
MGRVDHGAIFRKGAGTLMNERQAEQLAARTLRLGAYERISDDQEDELTGDRGAGVSRQREALELLCQMLTSSGPSTWTVHQHYTDNDISAFKDVVRPDFERLLDDLANGVVEGIVVYDLDRLARRPKDLERVIDIFDAAGKSGRRLWFATVHDKIDLSSPDGLTLARVMVAFANKSSRDTARRVAAKHKATALTGRPVGGTRPFGWRWTDGSEPLTLQDGRVVPAGHRQHVVDEEERAIIQGAASDILLGVSLNTICRDLNERGIRTTRGNQWRPGPLRLLLESPRLAGYRVHKGTFLPDRTGTGFVRGGWDPILDEDVWQQVHDTLRRRSARTARADANRRYLLSGILRCSECLGPMRGNARKDLGHFYACQIRGGQGGQAGCGKVSCSGPPADELIRQAVKARMPPSSIEAPVAPWPRTDELADLKTTIAGLVPELTESSGDARRLLSAQFTKLSELIEKLHAERATWLDGQRHRVRHASVGPEQFNALTVEKQRLYVRGEISAIIVRPADRKMNRFDYTRLSVVWKEGPDAGAASAIA